MNKLERLSSPVLALWFVAALGLTVFTVDPYMAALSLLCAGINLYSFRLLKGGRALILPAVFIAVCTVASPIFSHRGATELFFINNAPVTLESVVSGAVTGTVLGAATLYCMLLWEIFDDSRMTEILGRHAPKTALILSAALRFLPELQRKLSDISDARKAVGRLPENGSPVKRIKGILRVWSALLSLAFEDAAEQAALMRARGLADGNASRRAASMRQCSALRSSVFAILCIAFFGCALAGSVAGFMKTELLPHISLPRTSECIPFYICAAAILLLPIFFKGKGGQNVRS